MSTQSLIKFHFSFILQNHALGKLPGEVLFMLEKLHSIDFDDMPRSMPSYNVRDYISINSWK